MKINFNTMKKEPIIIEIKPITHLIVQDIVDTKNVYAIGYIEEENRLVVQYKITCNDIVRPEPCIIIYEDVPSKHFITIKHGLVDVFEYLNTNIIKNHISWKLPILDVWR